MFIPPNLFGQYVSSVEVTLNCELQRVTLCLYSPENYFVSLVAAYIWFKTEQGHL